MGRSETLDDLRARMRALESSDHSCFFDDASAERDPSVILDTLEEPEEEAEGADRSGSSSLSKPKRDAFSKIVGLINASERSAHEIRKRLKQAGYPVAEIDEALERAIRCGLVDDARYARILIQSRINQGWGRSGIERDLSRNGIDPASIEGWPYEYPISDDEQFEKALELLRRKPPRSKNLRESAYRKLVQKGYPSSIASQVARQWAEEVVKST